MIDAEVTGDSPESPAPARAPRSDKGRIRLNERDARAVTLMAEMYGTPYDLLAQATGVNERRLWAMLTRWRRAGLVQTACIAAGPPWAWPTQAGMRWLGYGWQPYPPPPSLVAHTRAALAARLWLEAGDTYRERSARWRPEREIRSATAPVAGRRPHIPDAEILWPARADADPARWAIEIELSPKSPGQLDAIIGGLLRRGYGRVVYLCGPAARSGVDRAAARLDGNTASRVSVRDLPPSAAMPGGRHVA